MVHEVDEDGHLGDAEKVAKWAAPRVFFVMWHSPPVCRKLCSILPDDDACPIGQIRKWLKGVWQWLAQTVGPNYQKTIRFAVTLHGVKVIHMRKSGYRDRSIFA
ncbi:hypothetical protein HRbin36_02509 [bacterium HR36]|nr:hypothetical protein HRbin36_02509 [bacterium HR36]